MQLATLTQAERDFLCQADDSCDDWPAPLVNRLSAVLTARLRQRVRVQAHVLSGHACPERQPFIQWDDALAAMWLAGRLGGHSAAGSPVLSRGLSRTLQLAMAEAWLSVEAKPDLPAATHLLIETVSSQGGLEIRLPRSQDMRRWARETLHHAR